MLGAEGTLKFVGLWRVRTPQQRAHAATVMVVDNAPFMRTRCAELLTRSGYHVVEAASGAEALARYEETKPDAVLMDIDMPDMDGVQALKKLVSIDPNVKVAMVTAMGQRSIVMECLRSGAKDFVLKPFDPERVMAAVKTMLG